MSGTGAAGSGTGAAGGGDGAAGSGDGLVVLQREGRVLFGCKGPRAADWLAAQGLPIPAAPNTWTALAGAGDRGVDTPVIARLGSSEFFLEDGTDGARVRGVAAACTAAAPAGVSSVLRQDWSFAVSGSGAEDFLAQVCNVHFAALDLAAAPVIMTLMVGVVVLIVPQAAAGGRTYRIWCDPTYGPYLGSALQGVVGESGGTYRGRTQ